MANNLRTLAGAFLVLLQNSVNSMMFFKNSKFKAFKFFTRNFTDVNERLKNLNNAEIWVLKGYHK